MLINSKKLCCLRQNSVPNGPIGVLLSVHLDGPFEKFFKIACEPFNSVPLPRRQPVNKQVDIAPVVGVSPRNGTVDPQSTDAVCPE